MAQNDAAIEALAKPGLRMRYRVPFRARQAYWVYEGLIAGLAVTAVWLITQPEDELVERASVSIWAIFVADYFFRLLRARDKLAFVRANVPDLIAIVPLDLISGNEELAAGRILRLARFVRLLRSGVVLWRVSRNVRGILATNGLGYVLCFMAGLVFIGGVAIWLAEPDIDSLGDGIWWSLVTATTVGYGDISPKTTGGRFVAGVLMLLGITTFGMVTATLTTYFMRRNRSANPHVEAILAQLERWDELTAVERLHAASALEAIARVDRTALEPELTKRRESA